MRVAVVGLVLLLCALHQDFWNWERHTPLVLGFIPAGLAHHVGISISAAIVGALAARFCWPAEVDALDDAAAPRDRGPC